MAQTSGSLLKTPGSDQAVPSSARSNDSSGQYISSWSTRAPRTPGSSLYMTPMTSSLSLNFSSTDASSSSVNVDKDYFGRSATKGHKLRKLFSKNSLKGEAENVPAKKGSSKGSIIERFLSEKKDSGSTPRSQNSSPDSEEQKQMVATKPNSAPLFSSNRSIHLDRSRITTTAKLATTPTFFFDLDDPSCDIEYVLETDDGSQPMPLDVSEDDSGNEASCSRMMPPPMRHNNASSLEMTSGSSIAFSTSSSSLSIADGAQKPASMKGKDAGKLQKKAKHNPNSSFLDIKSAKDKKASRK